MGYEQNFLTARKTYLNKIKDKKPSEKLTDLIEEDKAKALAKKLDQVKRYSEMNTALNMFESYRITYIKKIAVEMAHEDNADKLKPTLNKYGDALGDIVSAYEEECEKQRQAEMPPPPPPMPKPKVADGKGGGTNAITDAAVKIMLGKVTDGYRKRRQKQLDAAIEVEKDCTEQHRQIGVLIAMLQKEVRLAVTYSRGGQVREAAGLKITAQGQVKKIQVMVAGARKNFRDSLEPFTKERNLKAEEVAKSLHIDIPDAYVKELAKIPQAQARILTTANAHTTSAERALAECERMAEDAASLYSQIVDIAGGKDFGKLFLDGAVQMSARVKTIIDKAIAEAGKIQDIMIPGLAKHIKILKDNAPADRIPMAQTYVNTNLRLVTTSMGECADARTTAFKMIEAEKGKIPAEILKGETGKVIQQSEALVIKLGALNTANSKTAAPLLAEAEKLAK